MKKLIVLAVLWVVGWQEIGSRLNQPAADEAGKKPDPVCETIAQERWKTFGSKAEAQALKAELEKNIRNVSVRVFKMDEAK